MTSMVEKVREAVKTAWEAQGEVPFPLYDKEADAIARAAIAAMRDSPPPAQKVLLARANTGQPLWVVLADAKLDANIYWSLWHAAINAALAEDSQSHRDKGETE